MSQSQFAALNAFGLFAAAGLPVTNDKRGAMVAAVTSPPPPQPGPPMLLDLEQIDLASVNR